MLGFIAQELNSISIPYEFGQWTGSIQYPYWVGEYIEVESLYEDGKEEWNFILTGFTRGNFLTLETQKEIIKDHFWNGVTKVVGAVAYAGFYTSAMSIEEDDPELKKIQVDLKLMKWKVR